MEKTRITFYLTTDTVERAKNATFWTPGMTLSSLAERALEEAVSRLENDRGEAFPQRDAELAKGRPAK
ncbi:MAG: hypothetical protein D6E12_13215 [Desulfovibrio sp.]|nr:MAG: hypothetical protein D6E12_13215 [Desulfovibrio sp.]